jgi:L-ribulose-5-phosphate 3-epimerase
MTRRDFLAVTATSAAPAATRRFLKGFCAALFPAGMSYPECMRQARNAGFEAIELSLGRAELTMDCSVDAAHRLADAAAALKLEIASLWALTPSSPSLASPEAGVRQEARARVRKAIGLAPALGCGAVLVTPAVLGRGARLECTSDQAWQRATEAFREFLPEAARRRILLTPENVWSKFLVSPRDMRDFVDQFSSQAVAVHFDVGNVMQYGYPQDWILALGSRIRRVHCKDYKLAARGSQGGFVPLGDGDVQWEDVMAALRQVQYSGFISAETALDSSDPDSLLKISRAMDRILAMA